jgi:hypothetical protein
MSRLVRFRWFSATALVIGMLAATVGTALAAPPADQGLVPASGRLAGFTGGELLGEELRQLFALPLETNPFAGNVGDSCFAAGHKDKVLILWTRPPDQKVAECTVKPGTPIFLFAYATDCSNTEAFPFDGGPTEAGQRECALEQLQPQCECNAILVSIDGGPPTDIHTDLYRAVSPQMTVNLPNPNILGVVPARTTTFVAAGWVVMLRPLSPGTHTVTVTIVGGRNAGTSMGTVNVVPGLKG